MNTAELLHNVDKVLQSEGNENTNAANLSPIEKLEKLIIPAFENSRDIQSSLYSYQPNTGKGLLRVVKNKILTKVRNITIAVLERTIMRQQKVNELTLQALQEIKQELVKLNDKSDAPKP